MTLGDDHAVRQAGSVRLWSQVEDAWAKWTDAGQPPPEEFHIVVVGDEQRITHPHGLEFTLPQ